MIDRGRRDISPAVLPFGTDHDPVFSRPCLTTPPTQQIQLGRPGQGSPEGPRSFSENASFGAGLLRLVEAALAGQSNGQCRQGRRENPECACSTGEPHVGVQHLEYGVLVQQLGACQPTDGDRH